MADKKQKTLQSFFSAAPGASASPVAFKSIQEPPKRASTQLKPTKKDLPISYSNGNTQDTEPAPKRRKVGSSKPEREKILLDFGQKDLKTQCSECGMLFDPRLEQDDALHKIFHKERLKTPLIAWADVKDQIIVREFPEEDGIIVRVNQINSNDSKNKKIKELQDFVNAQLEMTESKSSIDQMYIYVQHKKVIGCVMVDSISEACRVVTDDSGLISSEGVKSSVDSSAFVILSPTKEKARVGISRLWVHAAYRERKVATRLVDSVRLNFAYGSIITKSMLAMSQPTPDGARFACKYFGTPNFLVYEVK